MLTYLAFVALMHTGAPVESPAVEVRFSQKDYLFARQARKPGSGLEGRSGYTDVMLHSFAIVNKTDEPVAVEEVFVELLQNGEVMQRTRIADSDIQGALAVVGACVSLGSPIFLDVPFGHRVLIRDGESVATSTQLGTNVGLIVNDVYLLVRGTPEWLRVTAVLKTPEGRFDVSNLIAVESRSAKNQYDFPLEGGNWYVFADGSLDSHHRFTQGTEFAIDITMLDEEGRAFRGAGRNWEDWYAYGKQVLAAARGRVVKVVSDSELDLALFSRQDGETMNQYWSRIGARQQRRFQAAGSDPLEVAGGNYLVIEHDHGEYSQYLHLAQGSVLVKEGDIVERGQPLASVGGTGELPWAHLHFQVTDAFNPDDLLAITTAHGIPVQFRDAVRDPLSMPPEPGMFVAVPKKGDGDE